MARRLFSNSGLLIPIWIGALLTIVIVWLTDVPLGVEGVWTWPRRPGWVVRPELVLLTVLAGGGWIALILYAASRIRGYDRKLVALLLLVLTAASVVMTTLLIAPISGPSGLSRAPFIQYYARTSGYYWEARYTSQNIAEYLKGYGASLETRPLDHVAVHPPGLILINESLIGVCGCEPVRNAIVASAPESQNLAFDLIESSATRSGRPFGDVDRCALWLGIALTLIGTALVAPAIVLVARQFTDLRAAWLAGALWTFVPAVAIFLPVADVPLALTAVLVLGLWNRAVERGSALIGAITGLIVCLTLWITLAGMAIGFVAGMTAITLLMLNGTSFKTIVIKHVRPLSALILTIVACWWIGRISTGVDLFDITLTIHQRSSIFFLETLRGRNPWMWLDPLIFAFGIGLPVVVAAAGIVSKDLRSSSAEAPAIAFMVTVVILGIVGMDRGEAIRHLLFMIPWVLIPAAAVVSRREDRNLEAHLLTAQMAVSIALVLIVDGFHFAG